MVPFACFWWFICWVWDLACYPNSWFVPGRYQYGKEKEEHIGEALTAFESFCSAVHPLVRCLFSQGCFWPCSPVPAADIPHAHQGQRICLRDAEAYLNHLPQERCCLNCNQASQNEINNHLHASVNKRMKHCRAAAAPEAQSVPLPSLLALGNRSKVKHKTIPVLLSHEGNHPAPTPHAVDVKTNQLPAQNVRFTQFCYPECFKSRKAPGLNQRDVSAEFWCMLLTSPTQSNL